MLMYNMPFMISLTFLFCFLFVFVFPSRWQIICAINCHVCLSFILHHFLLAYWLAFRFPVRSQKAGLECEQFCLMVQFPTAVVQLSIKVLRSVMSLCFLQFLFRENHYVFSYVTSWQSTVFSAGGQMQQLLGTQNQSYELLGVSVHNCMCVVFFWTIYCGIATRQS